MFLWTQFREQFFSNIMGFQLYTTHPHIHKVIDVIIGIQSDINLKINLINNKIINFKRKETIRR
ncbi:FLYWCH-type domain-containing protein [Aphis craccivora]|uniref:FLYWCH-type domain-containing protein n=1 Tax=Aphis craccivora TaxID=307492 RepID=A0A6G0Z2G0_APHCR|nr:FLYWCH-type domain-containing protein [Aphis craccivora]